MFVQFVVFLAFISTSCAGVPKPAWDCVEEKIIAKYHGESCTSEDDCFGRAMKCEEEKCACKENYVPAERFVGENAKQTVCVLAPNLFEECSTICQKPYVCKEHQEIKKKICHCEPPFKLTDNTCHLDCKENENYDFGKYRCVGKCTANEVKINDTCLKLANINDDCTSDKQCLSGFSECKNGKCLCSEGFVLKDGICAIDEVRCPNGQAVKSPTKCQFRKDPENKSSYKLIDNCQPDQFCYVTGGGYRSEGTEGLCCPKVESQCPVGTPHPTARCRSSPLFKQGDTDCPWNSHFCALSHSGGIELCCPRRCETDTVHINGKCYPSARLNDPCLENAQCLDSRTSCVNGFCRCSNDATEIKKPNYAYCSFECQPDEILHDSQCHKPLSLGDSCLNQTWRCSKGAICNKFNVCSCSCPRFTLSKDVCAHVPVCPAPRRYHMMARSGAMMGAPARQEPKYYAPITDEKRREILQNVTFCSIPGKEPPKIENVEKCPDGQYCASYISNLGMCCKIPEYLCPNGRKPVSVKQCATGDRLSCGLKKFCHDYLYTADPNSADGKMCCERDDDSDD